MVRQVSKSQIDRLGNRLRKGEINEADLRLLDDYRRSFGGAYELVVGAIRTELGLEPTGRPAKSTTSISEKLVRESIRLTQVQDIAGCRLVVPSILDQNRICDSLTKLFNNTTIVDRREKPSHGYRAVHVIVTIDDKAIEVQVRTSLQHICCQSQKERTMLFLIEYERSRGRVVAIREFDELQREDAEIARLELELELNRRGEEREVVLLEAADEAALRRTHRRYFEDLLELAS